MTQLLNAFNPMEHDPSQGAGQWPLGKHPVIIEGAEVKPTKDNSSGYLEFTLRVTDGPNAGHSGAYRLNLYNQSAKAAEIAHRQLSAICHVTQTFQLGADGTQLSALFGKPFVVDVGYQKGEEPGPNNPDAKGYTEIKRVFDIQGNEPGKQGQAAPAQAPQGFGGQQQAAQQVAQGPGAGAFQQAAPQGGAQAWGGGAPAQQQEAPQQAAQGGGWGAAQGGQPQQTAPAQGAWGQNAGGAPQGQPAWGQR